MSIPYMSSNVSAERSRERIFKLLDRFGVEELGFGGNDPDVAEVRFVYDGYRVRVLFNGKVFADAYRKKHPNTRKSRSELQEEGRRAAFRFAEAWLKVTLEGVEYGILDLSDAFLPHFSDAAGNRLGPTLRARLDAVPERERPYIRFDALPAASDPIIDAEIVEVG